MRGAVSLRAKVVYASRPWQQLQARLSWTEAARAEELTGSIQTLWERHSSDDLVSLFLVLIDAFVVKASVPTRACTHRTATLPSTLYREKVECSLATSCMASRCRSTCRILHR